MRFLFGSCVLDTGTRQLLREERQAAISPKAFQLLEILIRRRPEAVSKEELRNALWPATHVSETNLASLIAELREATGDSAREPRFIRTVHRFGYAFAADARERPERRSSARAGRLCRLEVRGERDFLFGAGEIVLGRDEDADVPINSLTVSRRHARIRITPEGAAIEDLGSKNGTHVNGRKVSRETRLASGDVIRLGRVSIGFELDLGRLSTETGVVLSDVIEEARRSASGRSSREITSGIIRPLRAPKRRG